MALFHSFYGWVMFHLSCIQLFAAPWTVVHQAPVSMKFHQARILEWVAISLLQEIFQPRDWTQVACLAGSFFTIWVTKEAIYIYACIFLNYGFAWVHTRSGIVGSYGNAISFLRRKTILFFMVATSIYISTSSNKRVSFSWQLLQHLPLTPSWSFLFLWKLLTKKKETS